MNFGTVDESDQIYDMPEEIISERKYVSRLFGSLTVSSFASYIFVILISVFLQLFYNDFSTDSFLSLLINDLYTVFAIFLFVIMTSKLASLAPVPLKKMTSGDFVSYLLISLFLMVAGSLIGNAVSAFVGVITQNEQTNVVEAVVTSYPKWQIAVVVMIIAPITEELLFRKLLINKIARYGTVFSVLFSGIVFGAFHGNFFQFFYGAMIGCMLAYVYCVYGRLLYCILIHSFVNFMGTVAPLYCMEYFDSTNAFLHFIASAYNFILLLAVPIGLILLISHFKEREAFMTSGILVTPSQTLKKNAGLIAYSIYTLFVFALGII